MKWVSERVTWERYKVSELKSDLSKIWSEWVKEWLEKDMKWVSERVTWERYKVSEWKSDLSKI